MAFQYHQNSTAILIFGLGVCRRLEYQMSYIILKKEGNKQTISKRILFPNSMSDLKKISKKLFKCDRFENENGDIILNVKDIVVGQTIIVKDKLIEENENDLSFSQIPVIDDTFNYSIKVTDGEVIDKPCVTRIHTVINPNKTINHNLREQPILPKEVSLSSQNIPKLPFMGCNSFFDDISKNFGSIPEINMISTQMFQLEEQQKLFYLKRILEYNSLIDYSFDTCIIDQRIDSIFIENRYFINENSIILPKIAIVGPPRSGKSSFLRRMNMKFIQELHFGSHWKKTFVYRLDALSFITSLLDYERFLSNYLSSIIEQISIQRPHIQSDLKIIEKQILQVFSVHSCSSIPPNPIGIIIKQIYNTWKEDINLWINHVTMLPYSIGKLCGFTSFHFIIDDVDKLNTIHYARYPFPQESISVFLIDHIISLMNKGSFIIVSNMESANANNIFDFFDIPTVQTYINLFDIDKSDEKISFNLEFSELGNTYLLQFNDCHGIPRFCDLFRQLLNEFEIINSYTTKEYQKDRSFMKSIVKSQELFDFLFPNNGFTVKKITQN